MHVHAEHSALGDATMREAFDYAFGPLAQGGAGLDFITLSDYVSGGSWGEVGRHQAALSRQAGGPQRGGDHLPRPPQQPQQREGRRLPRGADLRAPRGRRARPAARARAAGAHASTTSSAPAATPRSTTRRSSRRRCPLFDLALPRLPVGLHRRARPTTRRSTRSRSRPARRARRRRTAEPVHRHRDRVLRARARRPATTIAAVGVSDSHNAGRAPNPRAPRRRSARRPRSCAPTSSPSPGSSAAWRRATPT